MSVSFRRLQRTIILDKCEDNGLNIRFVNSIQSIVNTIQDLACNANDSPYTQGQEFMNSLCAILLAVKDSRWFRTDYRR